MENSLTSIIEDKQNLCYHETDEKNNTTPRKCKKCRQYIMEKKSSQQSGLHLKHK